YVWSLAEVLQSLRVREIQTPTGRIPWAEALADELMRRQGKQGSWTNSAGAQREDDPLVATPMAMSALAICRASLTGE
ncbi:MAG TPA: hypothetical protein VKE94_22290, partial [Gemmataceae bacterium]|nr:hypothetical protein [Gemmataceae bacterium]